MKWKDGKNRCEWANPKNERYINYHDTQWGIPVYEDKKLFEMLLLESFQAGLSWECILNKWQGFREAFDDFDVEKISLYDIEKIQSLIVNEKIVRNRLKIEAAVNNAKIFRKIQEEFGSFSNYIWKFTQNKVIYEKGLTSSNLSDRVSKDLKKRGMKFVGTTIIYSYMQAVGIIYSHEDGCFLDRDKTN